MKIYVGNLSPDATEDDLKAVFSSYGDAFVRLMLKQSSGDSRGFGYVEMENDSEAEAAIEGLDGKKLNDRPLVVTAAPRDLGTIQFTRPVLERADTSKVMLLARGEQLTVAPLHSPARSRR